MATLFCSDRAPAEIGIDKIGGIVYEDRLDVGAMCTIPVKFGNGERTFIKVHKLGFKHSRCQGFNQFDDLEK